MTVIRAIFRSLFGLSLHDQKIAVEALEKLHIPMYISFIPLTPPKVKKASSSDFIEVAAFLKKARAFLSNGT